MSTSLECPALESWQLLPTLPPEQQERYEHHLESCAACQSRLDLSSGGSGDDLLRLARQVGDPTAVPADPALTQALERLHEARSPLRTALTEPPDLYFLHPSDELGVLGTLGNYEVHEVIGQGGMGVVLKAFEPALHRMVAIKVMAAAVAGSATARRRFTREAQAAAAVCHDHVVAVHGVHEADGLPYLVMQYVPGESLQTRLDRTGPLEVVEIVRIGLQTAQGLAAAHAQGLIHRDIKPANLLLENGLARVKITDFGLARMVDDVGLTQNGVVTGTPEYMAPEQAGSGPIDHRADLFSLGSVLYAMCTGLPPFRGETTMAVLLQVGNETPVPVRALNPEVPAWLEALVDRLHAKAPADRIQTAVEVAELLEGYLAHLRQPVTVPAPELPSPPAADCLELPAAAFQTGAGKGFPKRFGLPALLLLAALGLGLAFVFAGDGAKSRPATPQEYYQSLKGDPENKQGLSFTGPDANRCVHYEPAGLRITLPAGCPGTRGGTGLAIDVAVKGDFEITVSFEILQEPEPEDAGPDQTRFTLDAGLERKKESVATLSRKVEKGIGTAYLTWLSLWNEAAGNTDKRGDNFPTQAKTGRLRLVRTGSVVSYYVSEGFAGDFTLLQTYPFSAANLDNIRLVGSTGGPKATLDVRVTDFRIRAESLPNQPAAAPPVAKSKTWLVVAEVVGLVVTLLLAIPLGVWLYKRQNRGAEQLAARPGGPEESTPPAAPSVTFRCSGCGKNLKVRAELAGKKGKCPQCGQTVIVPATGPGVAPAAPVNAGTKGSPWKKGWLAAAVVLLLGLPVGGWYLWSGQPKKPLSFSVTLGSEFVPEVEESGFHYQEQDRDGLPFRWTEGHAKLVIPIDKQKPPRSLSLLIFAFRPPDVKTIPLKVLVNQRELFNQDVPLWKWEDSFDLSKIDLGEELVLEIISDTFIPRGIMDGGANDDGRTLGVQVRGIKLLGPGEQGAERAVGDKPATIWRGHQDGIACGGLTLDGKTLVSGTWNGTIKIWDVAANRERLSLPVLARGLQAVAVSPDGKTFATAGNDRVVRLWDMETGQPRAAWAGHGGPITALAFAPDGQTLASAGGERQQPGELKLWDVATGNERVAVEPFPLRLWDVAYAADGRSVAVGGGDKTAYLVDTRTGKVLATFPQPAYVRRVALSPDGKLLAVAHGDAGEIGLHEVDGGKERSAFETPDDKLVFGLGFSRDGKQLLAPCGDGSTVLWDVSQPQPAVATTLKGHEGKVRFGVFFPDGQTVATGGDDRTIRLWRVGGTRAAVDAPTVTPPSGRNVWLVVGGSLALVFLVSCSLVLYSRHKRRAGKTLDHAAAEDGQASPELAPAGVSVRTPAAGAMFAAQAKQETVPAAVSFRCPGCGKNLKARPELAGKKVKCSHCGKAGLVPGTVP